MPVRTAIPFESLGDDIVDKQVSADFKSTVYSIPLPGINTPYERGE
jgi:hypothetical protein